MSKAEKTQDVESLNTAAAHAAANIVIQWIGEMLTTGAIEKTDPECFDIAAKCLPFKIRAALDEYTADYAAAGAHAATLQAVTAITTGIDNAAYETPLVPADEALEAMQGIMESTAARIWHGEPTPAAACQYCNCNIDSGDTCADCADIAELCKEA